MMTLARLWQAVSEHAVLLLVLLPLLGAIMTRLVGSLSAEGGRSVARANSWLSLLLLGILLVQFELPHRMDRDHWQLRSAMTWVRLPVNERSDANATASAEQTDGDAELDQPVEKTNRSHRDDAAAIRVAVGIDGVGLPFVVLLVAVVFAVVRQVREGRDEHRQLADVLLAESALLAVLTATDAVWLSVCLLLATGAMFVLISRVGEPLRRVAAAKFLRSQLLSAMMLIAGVLGLAVSCWWMSIRADRTLPLTFDLPTIIDRVPRLMMGSQAAHDYWELTGFWLFFLIAGGCVLRVALAPFHSWLLAVAHEAERGTVAMLIVGWIPTSCVLGLRLMGRVFEAEMGQLGERVVIWCVIAAFGMAGASIAVKESRRRLVMLLLSTLALCFGGLWIGTQSAIQGAGFFLTGCCAIAALSLLIPTKTPVGRLLFAITALLVSVPGGWCLLRNLLANGSLWFWLFGTIAAACWSIANWPRDANTTQSESTLRQCGALPLIVVMLGLGLAPQVVLNAFAQTADASAELPKPDE